MVGGRSGWFFVKWNCPGLATGEIGREEREAKCWMTFYCLAFVGINMNLDEAKIYL